tara:strand:- start:96 stop:296 length:201 start_codon:yes stop_codon:yes gene_type:complete
MKKIFGGLISFVGLWIAIVPFIDAYQRYTATGVSHDPNAFTYPFLYFGIIFGFAIAYFGYFLYNKK